MELTQATIEAEKKGIPKGSRRSWRATQDWSAPGTRPGYQSSSNDLKVQPINSAVAHRHVALAELWLGAGADVNAREQGGYTPLHEAAANGQVEMVKLLLSHGADVTCASDDGKTAIDLAQEKKDRSIAELLRQATQP